MIAVKQVVGMGRFEKTSLFLLLGLDKIKFPFFRHECRVFKIIPLVSHE